MRSGSQPIHWWSRRGAGESCRCLHHGAGGPLTGCHSRGDKAAALERGRAIAAGMAGARFVTLSSQNHVLLADEPALARLAQGVREFLSA